MEYEELTKKIIGCAFEVHKKMGGGFMESVYEKCLLIELQRQGLKAQAQKPINVYYDKELVGEFVTDIIVEDAVLIELKAVQRLIDVHEVQLVNYLVATNKPVGLLINFRTQKVDIKRKVRIL